MESPVSFGLKEEPASPQWGLELLDEVEGIWDCGEELVLDDGQPVVVDDEFWNHQGIAELIDKEEIFALKLDDIILEDSLDSENDTIVVAKREPFSSWLDNGALYDGHNSTVSVLPSYDSPTSGTWSAPESPGDEKAVVFVPPAVGATGTIQASSDLLREFEDVLSRTTGSLTPPDSPKSGDGINGLLQQPSIDQLQPLPATANASQHFIMLQDVGSPSVACEAELDQLMAETLRKNGTATNVILPSMDQQQMNKSNSGRPWDSPSNSSSSDSGYDDPDWCPAKSEESPGSSEISQLANGNKKLRLTSTEERRLRKKEQNKNAATRYRMRKKIEMEEIMGEEKELVDRNDSLKSEVVEMAREIRYLKGLMGELFRAKGLISSK